MEKKKQKEEEKDAQTTAPLNEEKEETGFPEDVDFMKFLGCGG